MQKLYLSHPGFEPKTCPLRERAANQLSQSEGFLPCGCFVFTVIDPNYSVIKICLLISCFHLQPKVILTVSLAERNQDDGGVAQTQWTVARKPGICCKRPRLGRVWGVRAFVVTDKAMGHPEMLLLWGILVQRGQHRPFAASLAVIPPAACLRQ